MDTGERQSRLSNVAIAAFLKNSAQRLILDAETLRHSMTFTIMTDDHAVARSRIARQRLGCGKRR
jgi:hypothetical protein